MTAHGMLFKTRRDSEQAEGELRKGERESSGNSRLSRVGSALNIGEAVASAHYATFAISLYSFSIRTHPLLYFLQVYSFLEARHLRLCGMT